MCIFIGNVRIRGVGCETKPPAPSHHLIPNFFLSPIKSLHFFRRNETNFSSILRCLRPRPFKTRIVFCRKLSGLQRERGRFSGVN